MRSSEQNGIFHARCRELANFWSENSQPLFGIYYNYTEEDVKTTVKRAYGPHWEYFDPVMNKKIKRLKSTSEYKVKEMSDLLMEMEALAVHQGYIFSDIKEKA